MIAIAGAKGGCGKTTVTLGLAEAYARAEDPAIAVDADRQLPTLHVNADVEREPTIADVASPADVTGVCQQLPGNARVGVLPAPTEEESVNVETKLATLAEQDTRVFVDCPSGTGPDLVDPLDAADRAVVVSTDTERSLAAAETTVDVAHRVGVPIAGLVLTRCSAVPEDVAERFDVPVLGAVPEADQPLQDEAVRSAFDDVVHALSTQTTGPTPPPTGDRLATGVTALDEAFDGGFPAGSVVLLEAPAASVGEWLPYRVTATRGTLYVSTVRSADRVRAAIDDSPAQSGSPTVRHVGGPDRLAEVGDLVSELPEGANLVVDVLDVLERQDRDDYAAFLADLGDEVAARDGLAVLHSFRDPEAPAARAIAEHAADVVLVLEPGSGERSTALTVSKHRFSTGTDRTVELDLPADVTPSQDDSF